MAARSNAASELARLWFEHRHGCFVRDSVQVPVKGNYSDIDFLVLHRTGGSITLPNGQTITARAAVEAKDEHDGPSGRDFAKMLRADLAQLTPSGVIPRNTMGIKFTLLKEEHFEVATTFLGTNDFDRLLIVHALDEDLIDDEMRHRATKARIHWLTIPQMVVDFVDWYDQQDRPTRIALRNTLAGDVLHLIVGFCKFRPAVRNASASRIA